MTSHKSVSRWGALALATGLMLALPAAPAFAADTTVDTLGDLQTALADCTTAPNNITLGANISAPSTALTVPCDTTLTLGIYDLSVSNIVISAGSEFTVAGPTDGTGGVLTADSNGTVITGTAAIQTTDATLTVTGGTVIARGGSSQNGAAIGGRLAQSGGTLNVAGGTVHASARIYGAAVGGGYLAGDGGVVTVSAGELTAHGLGPYTVAIGGGGAGAGGKGGNGAQVRVSGGVVTATADGQYGTAIGGGISGLALTDLGGDGGSLTIGAAGEAILSSPRNAFGSGWNTQLDRVYGQFGSIQVDGILRLPSGQLNVAAQPAPGFEVTVGPSGRILGTTADVTVGATIVGAGSIRNQGSITLDPSSVLMSGNNRLVQFSTSDPSVRVFAPSFTAGARTLPAPPSGTAWNTAANGSGSWFTASSSTSGSGTTILYAVSPATLAVSPDADDAVATSGEAFTFPVTVNGPAGTAISPAPAVTYTSTDCTIEPGNIFTVAGTCSITASATVQGVLVQTTFDIDVVAGPVVTLAITPSTATVDQGESLLFSVTGEDAAGNPVGTTGVVLTSSVATDVVTGLSVSFPSASTHTITATLGGVSAQAIIEVIPAPVTTTPTGSGLASSGADSTAPALGGLALLLAGAILLLARRLTRRATGN